VLLSPDRVRGADRRKTEWPSTQRDRRKTRVENRTLINPRGRLVKILFSDGRTGVEARRER
jgi:hypothetical protein